MSFAKQCGHFEIRVGEPHPRWVVLKHKRYGSESDTTFLDGITSDELHDLKYVIDRAIAFVEK